MDEILLHSVHLIATCAMIGLIWFVQIVHYPLFARVGERGFTEYERRHTVRTGWVVGPLMAAEACASVALAVTSQTLVAWVGVGIVGAIWLMTALVQVPMHGRLAEVWDPQVHARLVQSNWGRTVLWTARGPLAIAMFVSTIH